MTMPTGSFSFTKEPKLVDPIITRLRFGMAWKASGSGRKGLVGKFMGRRGADLDLLVVASEGPDAKRICWFSDLDPFDNGSLLHHGDNTTGKGDGDDEEITVDLTRMPEIINRLTVVGSAYKPNVTFSDVSGVTLNVYDEDRDPTRARYSYLPTLGQHKNAVVISQLVRGNTGWDLTEINEMVNVEVSGNAGNDQNSFVNLARRYARR
jgi:tellurium resistance protein TerZ